MDLLIAAWSFTVDFLLLVGKLIVDNAPHLVGVILPPFVQIINKDIPKERERFIVTIVICLFVGAILRWKSIAYGTPEDVLTSSSLVFVESQAVFKLYFKDSLLKEYIDQKVIKKEEKEVTESDLIIRSDNLLNP